MGSTSAMSSLDRVINTHGPEIIQDLLSQAPEPIRPLLSSVSLENNIYSITTQWVFQDGSELPGPALDIDDLASQYPDCDVGY